MKQQKEDILEKTLRELDLKTPSIDFSHKVLHQVQVTKGILRKRKNYLPVIPKILMGGFGLIIVIFSFLLLKNMDAIELNFENQLTSFLIITVSTMIGWLCFVSTDWMIRKIAT
ncbi:hypothetical protein QQ008_15400 [Fulvivirgaceae bacterium BMA10]|uniref:Uncharacterized protein n=1 Tax=Splendidivirga corallicola TaxID=3051826 RepID=A0ABT8KPW0_9BACT|nr:hypothetical protein [Fulvivirgaceae bacterium BMA10]